MSAPAGAAAAAERLAGLLAAVRAVSVREVDGLIVSMSPADLDGTYFAAEPGAVARLLSAVSAAAREAAAAAAAGIGAWTGGGGALSALATGPAGPLDAGAVAGVLRRTVLAESKFRIGGGMTPAQALESARLRGGRAAAGLGADTARGSYTAVIRDAGMGWARVPGAGACPFCLLMASRGPVYRTQQTAQGRTGFYHPWDRCRTLAVPRGARPGDYLAGDVGELVGRAAQAWRDAPSMDRYMSSRFAQAQEAARRGTEGPARPRPAPARRTAPTAARLSDTDQARLNIANREANRLNAEAHRLERQGRGAEADALREQAAVHRAEAAGIAKQSRGGTRPQRGGSVPAQRGGGRGGSGRGGGSGAPPDFPRNGPPLRTPRPGTRAGGRGGPPPRRGRRRRPRTRGRRR